MQSRVFASIAILSIAALSAQDQPPLVRDNSRLVLLDVVVTAKTGTLIQHLTQDYFTILENGTPQPIASFEEAGGPSPTDNGGSRNLILLDELNVTFENLSFARDCILKFLERNPLEKQPTALMAIGPRGLTMLSDFTTDNRRLKDKLAHLSAVDVNSQGGGGVNAQFMQEHGQKALHSLTELARATVGSPYRMNVIWITSGFSGTLKATGTGDPMESGLRSLSNLLIHSRMRLYTIDPNGVMPLGDMAPAAKLTRGTIQDAHMSAAEKMLAGTGGQQMSERVLLKAMTSMMGGVSYFGRNDVEVAIKDAIVDGSSAYRISYVPTNTDFNGEYRKIEVQIKVADAMARTRDGYYAVADNAAKDPGMRDALLDTAMASPLTYSGLDVACPAAFDAAKQRLTGKLVIKPQQIAAGADEKEQIIRIESFSKDHKTLDNWPAHVNWKNAWTNREVTASFDKVVSPKATMVRFLVSDASAERVGTCEYQLR